MGRLIWFGLLAGLAWWWWQRRAKAAAVANKTSHPTQPAADTPARLNTQAMLQCKRCGVHLPGNEALIGADQQPYCCAAHRDEQA